MTDFGCITGDTGDLFGDTTIAAHPRLTEPSFTPELKAARTLCRQLRRKAARPEKMRIAHLICLNLRSMLRVPDRMQRARTYELAAK